MNESAANLPAVPPTPTLAAPDKHPGIWSGIGTVVLYFLLQLGISALVGLAIGFWLALKAGIAAGMRHQRPDLTAIKHVLQTSQDIRVAITVVTIVAAAALMAILVHRFWPAQWSRRDLPGFGLAPPDSKLAYPAAVLLGFAVLVLGGLLTHALAGHHPIHQDITVLASKVPIGYRVLLVILAVCVAPFVEELVFRGVLLSGLASRMRVGWAIVVSAIVFGCAHLPDFKFAWYAVPTLVLLGLVLAWLRVRTRSLWPSITLHATNNFFAAMVWFMTVHH